MAGLEEKSSGTIQDNSKKKIFIPSQPSSFPWLNVRDNITFNQKNIEETKLQGIINLVGLEGYKEHFAHDKSLGFRFRLALGRALFNDPEIIFIDEPFVKMRDEVKNDIYLLLRKIHNDKKLSFVFGTSNFSEAIMLSDRLIVMDKNPGRTLKSFEIDFQNPLRSNFYGSAEYSLNRDKIKSFLYSINPNRILNFSL